MKINKRLIIIIAISGLVAGILSVALYMIMLSEASPDPQVRVPVLNTQIEKGGVILEGNISYLTINSSAVQAEVARDKSVLIGKKAVQKIHAGELIFLSDVADRGEVAEALKDLYIVGVDVSNISNFLGTQLQPEGDYYIITDTGTIQAKVATLVDTAGNAVYGDKQVPIKTVNLGVKTLSEVNQIILLEKTDAIELVKFPDKD